MLMVTTVPSMLGQFNMNNIRILLEMGYKVDVAADFTDTSVWPEERVHQFRNDMAVLNVECIQLDFSRDPFKIIRHINSYKETLELIKERQYAFIHTHTPIASAIVRLIAHKTRTRVIYTAHGFHFYDGSPLRNWIVFYPIEKFLSKWTDELITINKEDYKRATEKFKAKKTFYIPGVGIDTKKFAVCRVNKEKKRQELGVKSSDFLLLSVGGLSESKNQKVIIHALGQMKKEESIGNIVYLAVGKGVMKETFKNLISEYGIETHIKLLEFRTDIDELCETVDCFINLSNREESSIAPLEAMAAGLPLILAVENNIVDYTENEVSGCCIDPTSVDEIIDAIQKIRDDADFRSRCGASNWKVAKNFNIGKISDIIPEASQGYKHLMYIFSRQAKREKLKIGINDFVIISVGELNDNKNHQVIIRALSHIEGVKYVIVGKGSLERELQELAESLDIADRVRIMGFQTDVKELLWMSDCFAFPSKREGLGLAALEGMSAGLPLITSGTGGIKDYAYEGITATISLDNTVDEYVTAIGKLHNSNLLQMCRNCIEVSERFDFSKTDLIMREVYLRNEIV